MVYKPTRRFFIVFAVGSFLAIVVLSVFFREASVETLIKNETRSNVLLTRIFADSIWPKYANFLKAAHKLPREELKSHNLIKKISEDVAEKMARLNVVKVKIYDLEGLTVFSTEPKQVGADKSNNHGFQRAKKGEIASEITFRNEMYAFENIIVDRNIISSYLPIRRDEQSDIEAVFELYSDVTDLVNRLDSNRNQIVMLISLVLMSLSTLFYLTVKRADAIIRANQQRHELDKATIYYHTYCDALTQLPNRVSFQEQLLSIADRSQNSQQKFAVMCLNLDHFKLINNSLGHSAGDMLMQVIAKRLKDGVRELDNVFRVGGDEFIVLLEDLNYADGLIGIARRFISEIAEPITIHGRDIEMTCSIGIDVFTPGIDHPDVTVRNADAAMRRVKELGGQQYAFYNESMNIKALERLDFEVHLKRALSQNEYQLYYQPRLSSDDEQIVGAEALLRWAHPSRGIISPQEFIPYLENNGLIVPVGEWVLRTACEQAVFWHKLGYNIRVSVNISAKQFRSERFVNMVKSILVQTSLPPQNLELELTESLLVENTHMAINIMNALKEIGVWLSIDDFGTGYSSFSYLKQFPVDVLKIDRSFIIDVANNKKDAAITHAITTLAHSLNLGVVAEGVENIEQQKFLRSCGYHELQGFLFSKPLPAPQFEKLLVEKQYSYLKAVHQ